MYKAKLWDEDKWNIHEGYKSSKYGTAPLSDKKDDKAYHEQKYGSEKSLSSDYMKKEDSKEKEEGKKGDLLEELEGENKAKEEVNGDELPFKAAKQIFSEHKNELKKEPGKKDKSTIEDAIKKAIEEEKKVIMMDN